MTAYVWCNLFALLALACLTSASDTDLLLAFKLDFTNADALLSSWTAEGDPCDGTWEGVACDPEGQVKKISLPYLGLEGEIPRSGWELPPALQLFDVGGNSIRGTLPWTWDLPDGLTGLYLGENIITGSIPEDWLLPSTLTELQLNSNKLSGPVPAGLVLPQGLTLLYLHSNQLTGSLPVDWALPSSLQKLSLSNNTLSGTLPEQWALPQSLLWLTLSFNTFEGTIPTWSLPPYLQWFNLASNLLTGTIPASWMLPTTLGNPNLGDRQNYLGLNGNALSGPLPTWTNLINNRVTVQPGNIDLCGPVPTTPQYYVYVNATTFLQITSLPDC